MTLNIVIVKLAFDLLDIKYHFIVLSVMLNDVIMWV